MLTILRWWYRWQLKQNEWSRNELNALIDREFDVLARSDKEIFEKLAILEREHSQRIIRRRLA